MLVSIILPVYNEKRYIEEIVNRVLKTDIEKELIIVDDFSTDRTREILNRIGANRGIKIIYHEKNKGKGAAIRTALKVVSGDVVIIEHADLDSHTSDYQRLL